MSGANRISGLHLIAGLVAIPFGISAIGGVVALLVACDDFGFSKEYWVLTHDAQVGAYHTYMGDKTFGSRSDAELALRSSHPDSAKTFYTATDCRIVHRWAVADCRNIQKVSGP